MEEKMVFVLKCPKCGELQTIEVQTPAPLVTGGRVGVDIPYYKKERARTIERGEVGPHG